VEDELATAKEAAGLADDDVGKRVTALMTELAGARSDHATALATQEIIQNDAADKAKFELAKLVAANATKADCDAAFSVADTATAAADQATAVANAAKVVAKTAAAVVGLALDTS
jgi:hypothetical protein